MIKTVVDVKKPSTPLSRLPRKCIGSCHAYITLREDYREQVRMIQREIGFEGMRFHGIFNDLVGVCKRAKDGHLEFNFRNVDKIYGFLLEQGIKPFVELGFMPKAIASGDRTIFEYKANVTPPKDYAEWNSLVRHFVEHLIWRFGLNEVLTWRFEVWNEPDLSPWFWTGDQAEYFKLYENTAKTIKAVNANLKVGGPATSKSLWVKDMLDFCEKSNVPLDFISTHHYCADAALVEDKVVDSSIKYRGQKIMKEEVERTVAKVRASKFKDAEVHYTEWNVSPCHEDKFGKDSEFTATFVLQTLKDLAGKLDSYSLWCVSDIFEESGPGFEPFSGKYGLTSVDGIKKPVFHAYKFLSELHPLEIPTEEESLIVTSDGHEGFRVLVWNHCEPETWDFAGADWKLKEETREETIRLEGVNGVYSVKGLRVGRESGNAYRAWQSIGCPQYLTPFQMETLQRASEPAVCIDAVAKCSGHLELSHKLGPCSFILYSIEKA